jgi:hypothetical protein
MKWLLGKIVGNPLLIVYIATACYLAGIASGAYPAWKYQGALKEAVQAHYDSFVAGTKTAGELAAKNKAAQEAKDKRDKEMYDEQAKKDAARIAVLNKRLLHARSSGGYLPSASPSSSQPDKVCFSRTKFESAMGYLDAECSRLIAEGDRALSDLYVACVWAQNRQ